MTKAKHTPGPWFARYSSKSRNTAIESAPYAGNIGIVHGGLDPDCAANADLIAAAPKLLEALVDVMAWIDGWDPGFIYDDEWPESRDAARAAIAKGQGGWVVR